MQADKNAGRVIGRGIGVVGAALIREERGDEILDPRVSLSEAAEGPR